MPFGGVWGKAPSSPVSKTAQRILRYKKATNKGAQEKTQGVRPLCFFPHKHPPPIPIQSLRNIDSSGMAKPP